MSVIFLYLLLGQVAMQSFLSSKMNFDNWLINQAC